MEGLRALERSPVSHKCSTLIRVIHFIIRLFVLALSNMQHADGTEEDKKGMSENDGNEWRCNTSEKRTRRKKKQQLMGYVQRGLTLTTTFSVSKQNTRKQIQMLTKGTFLPCSIHLSREIPNCAIYQE